MHATETLPTHVLSTTAVSPTEGSITTPPPLAPTTSPSSLALPDGTLCLPGLDALEHELLQSAREVLGDRVLDDVGGYRLPAGFKLSILMPVYNERKTIQQVLARVRALPLPKEVIVIDDGSSDGTRELLRGIRGDAELRIVYHDHNRGKGAALRTGLSLSRGSVVVIQDADLEYDPTEFLRLVKPIVDGQADVVYGSRFLQGKPKTQTWHHWLANRVLTWLSNRFTGLRLTDMETCQKLFKREALAGVKICEDRFGVEPELTAKIARQGCRVVELPISYDGRNVKEGKKIGWKDAFDALRCIAHYSWRAV